MLTRVVLVATLGLTVLVAIDVLSREALGSSTTAWYLLLFTALFVVRVGGQILVALRAPAWLPPMDEWNLMPYRLLLPIQLMFVAVLAAVCAGIVSGAVGQQHQSLGRFLIGLSAAYAGAMVARYGVRMWRRPDERWFGGAIPIVFHIVLAGYLLTWGSYHTQG